MKTLICLFFANALASYVIASLYFLYFSNWKDASSYNPSGKQALYKSFKRYSQNSILLCVISVVSFVLSFFLENSVYCSVLILFVLWLDSMYSLYQVNSGLLKITKQSDFKNE